MTHIQNFRDILESGELSSYNQMRGKSYFNLANEDVSAGRSAISINITDRPLHDYVPLYFGFKTPMVAINQKFNEDLIFLRFSLDILSLLGIIITDGNARTHHTRFRRFQSLEELSFLDVHSIRTVKYAYDKEVKRRKQAEILVPHKIPISQILDIICYSKKSKNRVVTLLEKFVIKKLVLVRPGWYFRRLD